MACVYMAKSVQALPEDIQNRIEVHEWDMRTVPGNKKFMELRARSLPAIALDGVLLYEALIPGQEELAAEITERWRAKNSKEE